MLTQEPQLAAQDGASQVVADLLGDAADLGLDQRLLLAHQGRVLPQGVEGRLQHGQRRLDAVGQIVERVAIALQLLSLLLQQPVEMVHQAAELFGGLKDQLLLFAHLQLMHGTGQAGDGAKAPLGHEPDQRQQHQQVEQHGRLKDAPQETVILPLLRHGVDEHGA